MQANPPKLLIPQLEPFYRWAEPLSWALIRITAGLMLIPHGWPKLMMGVGADRADGARQARHLARRAARRHPDRHRNARRPVHRARPLHALLGRCSDHRDGGDRLPPSAEVRLDRARLRVPALLGPRDARHRAARRRAVLGRPGDRPRVIIRALAPVAQLDRVPGYEPGGRGFKSCRARQIPCRHQAVGGPLRFCFSPASGPQLTGPPRRPVSAPALGFRTRPPRCAPSCAPAGLPAPPGGPRPPHRPPRAAAPACASALGPALRASSPPPRAFCPGVLFVVSSALLPLPPVLTGPRVPERRLRCRVGGAAWISPVPRLFHGRNRNWRNPFTLCIW